MSSLSSFYGFEGYPTKVMLIFKNQPFHCEKSNRLARFKLSPFQAYSTYKIKMSLALLKIQVSFAAFLNLVVSSVSLIQQGAGDPDDCQQACRIIKKALSFWAGLLRK